MENIKLSRLTRCAVTTAIICIIGPFAIPLPFSPVPISLTQLGIYFAVYALGQRDGTMAVLLYLLIGALGLPVFSGFSGGIAKLAGPTGGYLIGFVAMAWILGFFIREEKDNKKIKTIVGLILGNGAVYIFGSAWLAVQTEMGFYPALMVGVVPYLPFDVIKAIVALMIGPKIKRI